MDVAGCTPSIARRLLSVVALIWQPQSLMQPALPAVRAAVNGGSAPFAPITILDGGTNTVSREMLEQSALG